MAGLREFLMARSLHLECAMQQLNDVFGEQALQSEQPKYRPRVFRLSPQPIAALVLTMSLACSVDRLRAEEWPSRPVTTVIGFAAGGHADIMARLLTNRISERLQKPFVVDARAGAGGLIAMRYVGQAPPDGNTIFFAAASQIGVVPNIQKTDFDPLKHLAPVSIFAAGPYMLVVNAATPAKSVSELVALAKSRQMNYGTGGPGTSSHLTAALFASRAGIEVTSIPFRGNAQAITALLAGQIDFMFGNVSEVLPQASDGKLRIIAVAADKRMKQFPDVPTIGETFPDTTMPGWSAVLVPIGTPKPIIDKLAHQIIAAARDPDIVEKLAKLGVEPVGTSPEEFAAQIKAEQPRVDDAIRAAGLPQ